MWGAKIEKVPYLRVLGQARFWEDDRNGPLSYESHMEDLVTGFHGQGFHFACLLLGSQQGVEVYLGLQGHGADALLAPSLYGTFPGISLAPLPEMQLGSQRKDTGIFNLTGRLTGIPTRKSGVQTRMGNLNGQAAQGRGEQGGRVQQIERLLRGLYGETWGYLVWASPVADIETVRMSYQRLSELTQVSARIHAQENFQATRSENVGPTSSVTEARSQTVDHTDRWAQYATELLERDLQRYQLGKAQGMWQVEVFYFAAQPAVLHKSRALLRAIFAGEDSLPDPLRTYVGDPGALLQSPDPFLTTLTSGELATFCQLPRQEFPGYRITDYAGFDVDVPPVSANPVPIGQVLDSGRPTGGWFALDCSDFAKHGLIVGVTGSGKTNTVFHLLDNLWGHGRGIPFLVIEPAKTEYRDLLKRQAFAKALRIYTLGDERVAPFRINPFVFEIAGAENRIHVQTHIDFLKSVFNAAFILYAPMPYVLETCLHEVYQDKGWDLTTGQNRRLPLAERGNEPHWSVFPTLTDLYNKIDEVVDRLGYEERISRDVKAGLKARIGSLRLGGKGLMLDTRYGLAMSELLSRPTVLELERIGNDDEKAFLIGLILTRLYEYRIVQAKAASHLPPLQHVTVFEEAHRLLKNTQTEVGTEEANTKAQAVEAFANMLSEIRAYGQGVLIAEQIPTKLAPDAIKNTNLKIMHRVVAADDREVMGGTMNLDEAQLRVVAALGPGQAAAYAEGADHPFMIQVLCQPEKAGQQRNAHVSEGEIADLMRPVRSSAIYDPAPGYSQYLQLTPDQLPQVRDLVQLVLGHAEFPEQFARYFLSLLVQPRQAVFGFNQLVKFIRRAAGSFKPQLEKQVLTAFFLHALENLFEARGRRYRWLYNVSGRLRDQLTGPLVYIAQNFENNSEALERLAHQVEADLPPFIAGYQQQTRVNAPFVGCTYCTAQCLYRWDVTPLLHDKTLERDFVRAIQNNQDDQVMWQQLARVAQAVAQRVLSVKDEQHLKGLAVCFTAQMTAGLGFSSHSQQKAAQNVKNVKVKLK